LTAHRRRTLCAAIVLPLALIAARPVSVPVLSVPGTFVVRYWSVDGRARTAIDAATYEALRRAKRCADGDRRSFPSAVTIARGGVDLVCSLRPVRS
jgi:hypothetical protein